MNKNKHKTPWLKRHGCFICSTINQKVLHYKLIIVQANIRRANGHHAGVFPDENLPQLQSAVAASCSGLTNLTAGLCPHHLLTTNRGLKSWIKEASWASILVRNQGVRPQAR